MDPRIVVTAIIEALTGGGNAAGGGGVDDVVPVSPVLPSAEGAVGGAAGGGVAAFVSPPVVVPSLMVGPTSPGTRGTSPEDSPVFCEEPADFWELIWDDGRAAFPQPETKAAEPAKDMMAMMIVFFMFPPCSVISATGVP